MTEREKLSASLQNFYSAQVYPLPSGGWAGAAAVKKNKRRRLALWLFFVTGIAALFMALLNGAAAPHPKIVATAPVSHKDFGKASTPISEKITGKTHPKFNLKSRLPQQVLPAAPTINVKRNSKPSPVVSPKEIVVEHKTEKLPIPLAESPVETGDTEFQAPSTKDLQIVYSPAIEPERVGYFKVDTGDSLLHSTNAPINVVPEPKAMPPSLINEQKSKEPELALASSSDAGAEQAASVETVVQTASGTQATDSVQNLSMANQAGSLDSNARFKDPFGPHLQGLSFELGASYLYGWNSGPNRDANGFTGYGGFNFTSILGDKSSVSVGLHYFQIAGLNASTKTSKVSSYAYGETSNITQITPVALHYALVPLRFAYMPSSKHQFGLGINLAYLLNVDAKIKKFEQSPSGTSAPIESKESGYMQGFNWYDAQATLFYRRRLGKAFAIQSELFFGLIDNKEDVFFSIKGKERNSGIKLGLMYYLITQQK